MSKHMQLNISIRPYYKKGLKAVYPLLAQNLSHIDKTYEEEEISLFELVRRYDKLLYESQGNESFRKVLLKHREKLHQFHGEIETHVADWNLAKADQLLYKIEDIFDEIEWELDKI